MRRINVGHAVTVVLVGACLAAAPSQAAFAAAVQEAKPHCAIEIFPVGEDETSVAETVCFEAEDDVAAYLASVTSGDSLSGSSSAAASVAVGTVYKDAGGSGASLTFWGSSGCSGVTFGFPTVPAGWDTTISSVRASGGCWATLYKASNYAGERLNCAPFCASAGGLNDSVRSLVFRPAGELGHR